MTAVAVEIAPRPNTSEDTIEVADLDTVVETVMCSCSAGDDQPY
ncbi:hypothetical protein TPA0910_14160 [Streptomyces hygroscopicus subsp. sporocinereus]|uniref:Uncharacterized protein n=1 Tax=Streptomyces hygroscopicus TaxID=1912 RepID=A0ABQ3TUM7_STRHY|nr:hypothetical protein [Streptomyces hygroscopicus]GHJ26983.1 hypothetical protein TPA0910_14160 [Streptomyces hygroscopicus]